MTRKEKAESIFEAIDSLTEACGVIKYDCDACGGCPISGICLEETTLDVIVDFLSAATIEDFLNYAYNEAEHYQWDNMTFSERVEQIEADIANDARQDEAVYGKE